MESKWIKTLEQFSYDSENHLSHLWGKNLIYCRQWIEFIIFDILRMSACNCGKGKGFVWASVRNRIWTLFYLAFAANEYLNSPKNRIGTNSCLCLAFALHAGGELCVCVVAVSTWICVSARAKSMYAYERLCNCTTRWIPCSFLCMG